MCEAGWYSPPGKKSMVKPLIILFLRNKSNEGQSDFWSLGGKKVKSFFRQTV